MPAALREIRTSALACLALLAVAQCTTEVCGCPPTLVPALVVGRVLRDGESPVEEARVHAFSAAAANCHSAETDFGVVHTADDGSFRMGLPSYEFQDSVCVFVFAHPPLGAFGLEDSDTVLLVMDFRDTGAMDSAWVELVLRAQP